MKEILQVIIVSILPIFELRGGIPLAIAYDFNPISAFLLCTLANIAVIPLIFLFLDTINTFLLNIDWYNKFFHKTVERAQHRVHKKVERYGYVGLMLFVSIPLPVTGAYTGALGAWALGMGKRKSFAAIALGVIIAGIIVTIVSYYGIHFLNILIKPV